MPPSGVAYNQDWLVRCIDGVMVHVASNYGWFDDSTFVPFTTYLDASGNRYEVTGIGDVTLPVKRKRNPTGSRGQGTMVLKNVMFAPTFPCNLIGHPVGKDYTLVYSKDDTGFYQHGGYEKGHCVAVMDDIKGRWGYTWWKVRLKGQGPNSCNTPDELFGLAAQTKWPESENERWKKHKSSLASKEHYPQEFVAMKRSAADQHPPVASKRPRTGQTDGISIAETVPRYTTEEMRWIKKHYGGELKFLASFGLKIHDEDDRARGRRIAREMIQDEESKELQPPPDFNGRKYYAISAWTTLH